MENTLELLDRITALENKVERLTPWAIAAAEYLLQDEHTRLISATLPNGVLQILDQDKAQDLLNSLGVAQRPQLRRFQHTGVQAPAGMRSFDEWLADENAAKEERS
jgi:hypothetical protein